MMVSCPAYFLTLKIEAIFSSETSIDAERTTQRCIPEDGTLHNHRCENLKSYNFIEHPVFCVKFCILARALLRKLRAFSKCNIALPHFTF
jgi:hypothetical protein